MKRFATLGISLALLLAMVGFVATRAQRTDAEIARLEGAVKALSEKVERLEKAPHTAATLIQVPSAIPGATRGTLENSNAAAIPSPRPESSAKPAASYGEQLAYYQASLQAEQVDANWSRPSVRHLRTIFDRVAGGAAKVRSVDCRQTICRAELAHDTEQAAREFMDDWMVAPARLEWRGPLTGGVESTDRDGTVHSVFYFAREGTELPEMH